MRFSPKNTVVDWLDQEFPGPYQIAVSEVQDGAHRHIVEQAINYRFAGQRGAFKKHIRYVTRPFIQAYLKQVPKLGPVLEKEPLGQRSGTYIFDGSDGWVRTTFFNFYWGGPDEHIKFFLLEFDKHKDTGVVRLGCYISNDKETDTSIAYISDQQKALGMTVDAKIGTIAFLTGFLLFCDTETKVLKPKEKHRAQGIKYFNETAQNIEVIDSSWFTTLVTSEGFGVSGHFRLQPYKDGTKKLIWIKPYEKSGYTRTAKIETTDKNNI